MRHTRRKLAIALLLPGAATVGALLVLGSHERPEGRAARARGAREGAPALPAPGPEASPAPEPEPAAGADRAAPGLAALLLLLDDPASPRRDRIAREVARRGGDEAWEGLVARLGDPALRSAIEIALGELAPKGVIDALKREMLDAPEPEERASVARILAATADPAHGADIRALLRREREPEVRHPAIGALGRFGDRESAGTLVDLMRAGGQDEGAAHFALVGIRNEETLRELAARWPALPAGARLGLLHATERPGPEAVAAAREALADADERLRLAAVGLLAHAGDEGVAPLLDHALRRPGEEAEVALRGLAELATPRAAEAGLRALATLPPSRQERYRAGFLAALSR
jgi:HEAT repeat protein